MLIPYEVSPSSWSSEPSSSGSGRSKDRLAVAVSRFPVAVERTARPAFKVELGVSDVCFFSAGCGAAVCSRCVSVDVSCSASWVSCCGATSPRACFPNRRTRFLQNQSHPDDAPPPALGTFGQTGPLMDTKVRAEWSWKTPTSIGSDFLTPTADATFSRNIDRPWGSSRRPVEGTPHRRSVCARP